MIFGRSDDWLAARAGDEIMMMNATRGTYLGLNAMGARIWDLLAEPREIDWLCEQLVREFEVSEPVCRSEVQTFLDELINHKAIVVLAAPRS